MTELRRRKNSRYKNTGIRNGYSKTAGAGGGAKETWSLFGMSSQQLLVNAAGLLTCLYLGYKHAWYMSLIHENNMWFSNIKVVEFEHKYVRVCL